MCCTLDNQDDYHSLRYCNSARRPTLVVRARMLTSSVFSALAAMTVSVFRLSMSIFRLAMPIWCIKAEPIQFIFTSILSPSPPLSPPVILPLQLRQLFFLVNLPPLPLALTLNSINFEHVRGTDPFRTICTCFEISTTWQMAGNLVTVAQASCSTATASAAYGQRIMTRQLTLRADCATQKNAVHWKTYDGFYASWRV